MTHVETLMRDFARMYRELVDYPSLHEVMLDRGRSMSVERLTFDEARQIVELSRWAGFGNVNDFETKACYITAQKLITCHDGMGGGDELQYCEGYIAWDGAPLPIDHAWVTINGKVVDVTLRAKSKTERHSYYGVEVPVKLLVKHMLETRYYCPVIEGPYQHKIFPRARRRERSRAKV
jgi:hypothetical protein